MNEKTKRVLELDEAAESRSSNPLASDAMEMYEAAFIDPLEYGDVIRMLPKLAQEIERLEAYEAAMGGASMAVSDAERELDELRKERDAARAEVLGACVALIDYKSKMRKIEDSLLSLQGWAEVAESGRYMCSDVGWFAWSCDLHQVSIAKRVIREMTESRDEQRRRADALQSDLDDLRSREASVSHLETRERGYAADTECPRGRPLSVHLNMMFEELHTMRFERNAARAIARVLAHAYSTDNAPPHSMVDEALGFAVDQRVESEAKP